MSILRSIVAVIVGFLIMVVLVIGTSFVLVAIFHKSSIQQNQFTFELLNLVYVTFFGVIAGYITGKIAQTEQVPHSIVLGLLLGIFAVINVISASKNGLELWFPITNSILQFSSTLLGGYFSSVQRVVEKSNSTAI